MMNIAIIGIGLFGNNHVRVIKELGHNIITCDLDKRLNPDILDYKNINVSEIDAVIVATVASSHYGITKYFLEKGCPTLVEKPMTLDYNHALELVNISENNNITFAVGHIFRYHPLTDRMIKELKRINQEGQRILAIRSQRIGLHSPRYDCGVVYDFGIHDVDLIDYILRSVFGCDNIGYDNIYEHGHITKGYPLGTNNEDISCLNYDINGIFTQIDVDWINPIKNRSLTFICTNETIEADFVKEELRIHKSGLLPVSKDVPKGEGELRFSTKMGDTIIPKITHEEPLKKELEDFIYCVEYDKKPISNARSCLFAIKFIDSLVGIT